MSKVKVITSFGEVLITAEVEREELANNISEFNSVAMSKGMRPGEVDHDNHYPRTPGPSSLVGSFEKIGTYITAARGKNVTVEVRRK